MDTPIKRQATGKGFALSGLMIGSTGLFCCWVPWFGLIVSFLGIVFGILAFTVAEKINGRKALIIIAISISLGSSFIAGIVTYTYNQKNTGAEYFDYQNYYSPDYYNDMNVDDILMEMDSIQ